MYSIKPFFISYPLTSHDIQHQKLYFLLPFFLKQCFPSFNNTLLLVSKPIVLPVSLCLWYFLFSIQQFSYRFCNCGVGALFPGQNLCGIMANSREWDLGCKVYIGNLARGTSKYDLEDVFRKFGPMKNVWVARSPPGFAFVQYEDPRDAEDAVRALDGTWVMLGDFFM